MFKFQTDGYAVAGDILSKSIKAKQSMASQNGSAAPKTQ